MAAKIALYVIGGLIFISGIFQLVAWSQLSENSSMTTFVPEMLDQQKSLAIKFLIGGLFLIAVGMFISKPKTKEVKIEN